VKLVASQAIREFDRRAISELGVPGETLMERAGGGVARSVVRLLDLRGTKRPVVELVAGRGNNGGDAFVAARRLKEVGIECRVKLAGAADTVRGDALTHLRRMTAAGIPLRELPREADWAPRTALLDEPCDLVVDGLLGTGAKGAPTGAVAAAVGHIRCWADRVPVVAIDLPSGLDADTGDVPGGAVVADLTVTMAFPKLGFVLGRGIEHVGSVEVADIGFPIEWTDGLGGDWDLVTAGELRRLLPRRARAAHKGDFGRVVLIGGAAGYAGAIGLAARAAVRSGVGLVSVVVPASLAPVVAAMAPESMVHAAAETERRSLSLAGLEGVGALIASADAVLVGPGMTTHAESGRIVEALLRNGTAPLVVDADALNAFAGRPDGLRAATGRVAITPHPGEMGRLLGRGADGIQADRVGAAREAAQRTGAVTVLKGAGTLICAPGTGVHVNLTGNPGMATGGTGDVLAGLLAGLLAQGLSGLDAARVAVFLHGHAGDRAAWRGAQAGLSAGALVEELPMAFRAIAAR
jgi:hydroxyethylthiazole kinase-like uncharacterized protein yjeF